jgi:hypothetical protein
MVIDPGLAATVDEGFDKPPATCPGPAPNRLTIQVPTENTRFSLGQASSRWNTDTGIVGISDSHVHFETKANDKTIVSLGTSATTASVSGHGGAPPTQSVGYAMVTQVNAWHEAALQHYLVSQTKDMSLRTAGASRRAVVQADAGMVDLNAKVQVNLSGGGVSIAASELELEPTGYDQAWKGLKPKSAAKSATQIANAIISAIVAALNIKYNHAGEHFAAGAFAGSPASRLDKAKWAKNALMFGVSGYSVYSLFATPEAPPNCVKISADDVVGGAAGGDVSIFGLLTANLGSSVWTTVSSSVSASIKGLVLGGMAGAYASVKGIRKVDIGSDWGMIFLAAEKEIELKGKEVSAAAKVAHVAAPDGHGVFAGTEKLWFGAPGPVAKPGGTPGADGYGVIFEKSGLTLGAATVDSNDMSNTKIKTHDRVLSISVPEGGAPSIQISASELAWVKLEADACTFRAKNKPIRFTATSGSFTINSSQIRLN